MTTAAKSTGPASLAFKWTPGYVSLFSEVPVAAAPVNLIVGCTTVVRPILTWRAAGRGSIFEAGSCSNRFQ